MNEQQKKVKAFLEARLRTMEHNANMLIKDMRDLRNEIIAAKNLLKEFDPLPLDVEQKDDDGR